MHVQRARFTVQTRENDNMHMRAEHKSHTDREWRDVCRGETAAGLARVSRERPDLFTSSKSVQYLTFSVFITCKMMHLH